MYGSRKEKDMKINTVRFGELEMEEQKVINFVSGPMGFENMTKWVLIDNGLLGWLQSVEDPELAFVVANPFEFYGDYEFEINESEMKNLAVINNADVTVLSIVSVPPKVENMTINLLAPIVINYKEQKAKQVILSNNKYSVRHYVYSDLLKCSQNKKEVVNA